MTCYPIQHQRDARWVNSLLGNDTQNTIGNWGCLLTCYTMLVSEATGVEQSVLDINAKARRLNMFQPAGAGCPACITSFDLTGLNERIALLGFSDQYINVDLPGNELVKLQRHLDAGNPAVVLVDINLQKPGIQSHYVLATGRENGAVMINDPWVNDSKAVPMVPRYGANEPFAIWQIIYYSLKPATRNLPVNDYRYKQSAPIAPSAWQNILQPAAQAAPTVPDAPVAAKQIKRK